MPTAAAFTRRAAAGFQPDEGKRKQHGHDGAENNPVQNILPPPARDFKREPGQRQDEKFQRLQLAEGMFDGAHARVVEVKSLTQPASFNNQNYRMASDALCNLCANHFFRAGFARGQFVKCLQNSGFPAGTFLAMEPTPTAVNFCGRGKKTTTQPTTKTFK